MSGADAADVPGSSGMPGRPGTLWPIVTNQTPLFPEVCPAPFLVRTSWAIIPLPMLLKTAFSSHVNALETFVNLHSSLHNFLQMTDVFTAGQ